MWSCLIINCGRASPQCISNTVLSTYRFIKYRFIIRLVLYGIKKVTRSNSDQRKSAATNCYPRKSNFQTLRSYKQPLIQWHLWSPSLLYTVSLLVIGRHHFKHQTLHCMCIWNDLTVHQSCHQGGFPTTPSDEIISIQNYHIYTVNVRWHYQWSNPTPLFMQDL